MGFMGGFVLGIVSSVFLVIAVRLVILYREFRLIQRSSKGWRR